MSFDCEFFETFKNTYFVEHLQIVAYHLRTTGSVKSKCQSPEEFGNLTNPFLELERMHTQKHLIGCLQVK